MTDPEPTSVSDSEKLREGNGNAATEPTNGAETQNGSSPETTSQPPPPAPGPVPDGGLDAWLQVLGSWSVLVVTWGLVNTFGVFQAYYEDELLRSSSPSSISWIGSIQAAMLMWFGVLSGPLFDAGYFKLQVTIGCLMVVFGQFMTSICKSYYQVVLAQGVCTGIGMGLAFLPSTAILAQYFHKRRALAIGLASSGSPLAGIVFPIIFSKLLPHVGFGWATRVIAFIVLAFSVPPVAFMHYRVKPTGVRRMLDKTAFRDATYLSMSLGAVFAFLTLYVAFFYIEVFDEQRHLSSLSFAPYTVTLLNVGSVFGRLLPNIIADKIGSLNVITFCTFAAGVLLFGWFGVTNLAGLAVFALLYGLFSGAIVSLLPSVAMTLTPDLRNIGARMGLTFLFAGLPLLVGTPIAGAILRSSSGSEWKPLIGYSAGGLILGSLGFGLSRFLVWREKKTLRA